MVNLPNSCVRLNFHPQNTQCILPVANFVFLELEQISLFLDGHYLVNHQRDVDSFPFLAERAKAFITPSTAGKFAAKE